MKDYFLNCMDPGGDTGLAILHVKSDGFELLDYQTVTYRPSAGEMPTSTLIEWRLNYPGIHDFVYEDFHIRNRENAAATDTTALRVIGSVEQMIYDRNLYRHVISQEPVAGKFIATDEVLEKLGLHLGHQYHQRHVRDGLRHGVALLSRRGYRPVCEVINPRRKRRAAS